MGNKFSLDEARQRFIDKDLIPLFDRYNNTNERLLAQTKEGYYILISINHLTGGRGTRIFHKSNPYTILNIKLWCKLNNKPFELMSEEYNGNGKKLKWKCLKDDCREIFELEWEQAQYIKICPFCNGKRVGLSNCLATKRPDLIKYLRNKDDQYKYPLHSDLIIPLICPNCGFGKEMKINRLTNNGFSCPKCGDGISYPEKFIFNLLEQLNIEFLVQLSKKTFKWCNTFKYDFYIFFTNCIIETHGNQHYKQPGGKFINSLKLIQQNDNIKEQLALSNSINKYIIIDCRYSEIEWIKNSVMNSELPRLLNFKKEDIDWLKCHEYACNSLVKVVCDLWNNGYKITTIMNELKISKTTIRKYLKQGLQLGFCNYNPKEEMIKNINKNRKVNNVICLNTNEVFKTVMDASKKYTINNSNINLCCKGKRKSAGKHPITGEKMVWMYYEDWVAQQDIYH